MATRIVHASKTLTANQTGIEFDGSPLTPPAGLKWTVVELRPTFQGKGQVKNFFDTELYHELPQEDVVQYGKPHTVALDIVQPHKYVVKGDDRSGAGNEMHETVVFEESPAGAA